jgi:hypothetical protein
MQTRDITTSNKYVATIKNSLTFQEHSQIKTIITSGVRLDQNDKQASMSGDTMLAADQKALDIALIKLVDPQGVELANPAKAIGDIPALDGTEIMDAINQIRNSSLLPKSQAT